VEGAEAVVEGVAEAEGVVVAAVHPPVSR
jgi:hypothetical protein